MIVRQNDPDYHALTQEFIAQRKPAHLTLLGKRWKVVTDNDEQFYVELPANADDFNSPYGQNSFR